ncbi:Protein kinase domain-containing protein [Meloidogyne graminicola]|uniref:non-specific serine/threonine protein kinase n=1 Tax=Meloidogyne graminicola TaxID=189291 RepID=A0A8S9ZUK1_9BILA|nr:Protein kinase domain-containing protein [Meloidogyne graminicola]
MGGCISSRDVDVEIDGKLLHLKKIIASGGFSQIYLAEDASNNEKFAIKKILCHGQEEVKCVKREIELLIRFGQLPNILPFFGFTEGRSTDPTFSEFCLVFPFCRLGSLQEELARRRQNVQFIERKVLLQFFKQICEAIGYLHNSKPAIAHRDLKPGNLMFFKDFYTLQLIDFGSAMECPKRIEDTVDSRKMLDEAGQYCTMPYRAPELFTCEVGVQIDESVDIWSLGCVFYALCYFISPFDEVHERGDSVALAVQSAKLVFNKTAPFNEEIISLISSLILVKPLDRPKILNIRKRVEQLILNE